MYPVSEAVAPEITHFHWQGMQLTGEHRNEVDDTPTYYFYEEGSYTPLVKLDCVATENQIYFYHAEQDGMPVMLTDAEGRVSWQQQSQTLWGTVTANHNLNTDTPLSQPLRFADNISTTRPDYIIIHSGIMTRRPAGLPSLTR